MEKSLKSFDITLQYVPLVLLFCCCCCVAMIIYAIMIIYNVQLQLMKYTSLTWKKENNLQMYPFVPLRHRFWDKFKSAWDLLGVNVSEDKKRGRRIERGKPSEWNAELIKSGPTQQRVLKQDWPTGALRWGEMANASIPIILIHWGLWDLGSKDKANLQRTVSL